MPREALHKTAHEVIAGSQNPTGVFMGTCGLFGNYHWETGPTIGNPGEFYNATHRTRTDSTEVLSITGTGCLKARWRAGALRPWISDTQIYGPDIFIITVT